MRQSYINNMVLSNERRNTTYQAVLIDLYLCGAIPKEVVEGLTNTKLLDNIKLPEHVQQYIIEQSEENLIEDLDPVDPDPKAVNDAVDNDDNKPEEPAASDITDPDLEE